MSLIWLALIVPVVIVLAAFVIDAANWYEHRRHLQLQVDSAALAGGGSWVFTYASSSGQTTCSDSTIENEALNYAGDQTRAPSTFNTQVSNAANVHVLFNSPSYWTSAASSSLENTISDPPGSPAGGPCTTGFIDVKATDDKPPLIVGNIFSGLTPSIHAHARVDFFVADTVSGSQILPLAMPDPTPRRAYAYFVHESGPLAGQVLTDASNNPLPAVPLFFTGVSQNGVDYWNSIDMSQSPPTYYKDTISNMPAGNVGVRIALSGNLTNSQCGQPLVSCYDTSGNAAVNGTTPLYGIDNIRVFDPGALPGTGSAQAAMTVYGAKLTSTTCTNPYFPTASCSVQVHVRVAFAGGITAANVPTIWARVDGATQNNQQFALVPGNSADCPAANPAGSLCYETQAGQDLPIASSAGWHTIDLAWKDTNTSDTLGANACKNGGSNPCDDTNTVGVTAQRVFFGTATNAGPLKSVDILDNSSPTPILAEQPGSTAFHSYAQGASATLGVQIGIQQAFATAAPNSPPVTLRAPSGSGSQTQAIDCNPSTGIYLSQYQTKYGTNFWNNTMTHLNGELQFGCAPSYTKWDGAAKCPGNQVPLYPGDKGTLWNTTQPWFCAAATTGSIDSAVGNGLNGRILGNPNATTCPPLVWNPTNGVYGTANGHNNWDPVDPGTGIRDPNWTPARLPDGDPRIVFLFLTPFGTFNGSGSDTYPVTRFATFYVTGWQSNGGNGNPCQGNGDDTAPSAGIVGHFMTYSAADTSVDSTKHIHCTDPNGIDLCVAKLTQ